MFCEFDPATANGVSCLKEPETDIGGNRLPQVGVNYSNTTLFPSTLSIPPRSLMMHPGIDMLAIVAWKSPVNGKVRIAGSFSDIDAVCGDGILWYFIVHPKAEISCDSTRLQLIMTRGDGD